MDKRYLGRIPNINNFEEKVCREICESYGFGDFESYSVIETGYEDFNFVLTTNSGKYFVKVFSKTRKPEDCKRITDLLAFLMIKRVHHPKIYKDMSGDYLHKINIGIENLFLVVMDFIDGKNFFELNAAPNKKEIVQLANDMAQINSIKLKGELSHIYDSWAILNFGLEYEKKKKYLKNNEIKIFEPLINEFNSTDFEKLPKSLVHGDLLKTNVLKDKLGKIWIVDFSVANLYPRILEIAIAATHLLFDSSKEKTAENLKTLLEEYGKHIKLTHEEKEVLPKFMQFSYAIEYLNTIIEERVKRNKSNENCSLHEEAKTGLEWGDLL